MGNNKTMGTVLMVVGAILLIASLTVDMIGIGHHPGFGRFQITGIVVGVLAAGIGFVLNSRK